MTSRTRQTFAPLRDLGMTRRFQSFSVLLTPKMFARCTNIRRLQNLCTPKGLQGIAQGRDRRERTLGHAALARSNPEGVVHPLTKWCRTPSGQGFPGVKTTESPPPHSPPAQHSPCPNVRAKRRMGNHGTHGIHGKRQETPRRLRGSSRGHGISRWRQDSEESVSLGTISSPFFSVYSVYSVVPDLTWKLQNTLGIRGA